MEVRRPYTARALKAIELAHRESASLGHEFVGTEHLLLGLLEERTGPAAQMLTYLGVTADQVRTLLKHGPPKP